LNGFPNKHAKPDPHNATDGEGGEKKKKKGHKEKEPPKPLGGAWKPISNAKSGLTRSLLRRFY